MQEPTLIDARNRLKQIGLIDFVGGKKNEASPVYRILYLNNLSKDRGESIVNTEEKPSKVTNSLLNKTETKPKLNKTTTGADAPAVEKKVLVNPFSEEFLTEWQIWRDYKKSEHRFGFKSVESEQAAINELVNLSGGSEETAKAIIRQSLAKGWKGLFHLKNDSNGQAGAKNGQPGAGKSKATSAELHALHLKRFGKAG
ncbi:MAG TPA: hypothetical protein VFT06_10350 [Flavisolibacter sp.]|nr:hypothetical protein [Flavisolibacter sp.]